jgi:hypothetical protein
MLLALAERRAAEPILPPELFRNSSLRPRYCRDHAGHNGAARGRRFLAAHVPAADGGRPRARRPDDRTDDGRRDRRLVRRRPPSFPEQDGYKVCPVLGLVAATLSCGALVWGAGYGIRLPPIEAVLVVMGLGIGLVMPNLTTAIQNAVPRRDLSAATASAAFFRSLGGALGAAWVALRCGRTTRAVAKAQPGAAVTV